MLTNVPEIPANEPLIRGEVAQVTSGFEHQLRQDYDRRIELIGWAHGLDLRHQLRGNLGEQQDQLCPYSFVNLDSLREWGQQLQPFYHPHHHQELKVQQQQQPQQHQFRDQNQLLTH